MIRPALPLILLNLLYIGLLPRIFFRKNGRFNLMWWATAAPFLACTAYYIAPLWGALDSPPRAGSRPCSSQRILVRGVPRFRVC